MIRPAGLLVVSLLAAATASAAPGPVSVPTERQAELIYLVRQDCGSCHGLTLRGGLGPPLVPGAIADKDHELLIGTILDGRPGTPMPPWRFEISPDEAAWLVHRLREGLGDGK